MKHHEKAYKWFLKTGKKQLSLFFSYTAISPSALYSFLKRKGSLDELREVTDLIFNNYYLKITVGECDGIMDLLDAEIHINRCEFNEAAITNYNCLFKAKEKIMWPLIISGIFMEARLNLIKTQYPSIIQRFTVIRESLSDQKMYRFLHLLDICEAYVFALSGIPEKAADWLLNGDFKQMHLYGSAISFCNMVYCSLLLSQEKYARLLVAADHFLNKEQEQKYLIYEIYLNVYRAIALKSLNQSKEANRALEKALQLINEARILLPFTEYGETVCPMLNKYSTKYHEIVPAIIKYGKQFSFAHKKIADKYIHKQHHGLTNRKYEIALLATDGLSNKEIAQRLVIGKSTVKSTFKLIYGKLGISNRVALTKIIKNKVQRILETIKNAADKVITLS